MATGTTLQQRARQRGVSLIELLAVVVLVLAFIFFATVRIWELRIAAERTGIEYLVGTLRSALGIQLVGHIAREGTARLERFDHSNPIAYLKTPPANYLGAFDTAPEEPVAGAWYFDRKQAALVYRVRFADYLVNDNYRQPELIRFQVQLRYRDANGNGRFEPALDAATGLDLIALDRYRWVSLEGDGANR
jgi:hypothetical protein